MRARIAWTAVALLGAILLVPTGMVAHVEGFSTAIISLGLHIRDDTVRAFDFLYPANLQYFALSRLGAALGVALLSSIPGVSGTLALALLVWSGLVGLLVGTWVLVRRWTGAPPLVVAAAFVIVPAMTENGYIYNDNVPSAALTVGAMAVLACSRRLGPAFGAGLLFGLGMVTRADAVLLGPAVLLILVDQDGVSRASIRRGLAFGIGLLIPLVGILAIYGMTYLDVLKASTYAVYLWNRSLGRLRHVQQFLIFFGIPGLALLGVGVISLARRRQPIRIALLIGVPLLYNLITLGKLWEARQLLPLTPMLVSLVVIGWQAVARRPRARWAIAALTLLAFAAPPAGAVRRLLPGDRWPRVLHRPLVLIEHFMPVVVRTYDDGPRVLFGRLWNLAEWRRWQQQQNANQVRLRAFASELHATPMPAVITDEFTADEYIHLALQEAGYAVRPAGDVYGACGRVAELWQRGDSRVLHVRLHVPFVTSFMPLIIERYETNGLPCLAEVRPSRQFYVERRGWAAFMFGRTPDMVPWPVTLWPGSGRRDLEPIRPSGDDPVVVVQLDSASSARLRFGFAHEAEHWRIWAPPRERHFMTRLRDADSALTATRSFPRWEGL